MRPIGEVNGERDLREAVRLDALELAFQPIVSLDGCVVHGYEALLRWEGSCKLGWSIDRMIEVADHSGLIVPIGRWVIERTCQQIATWRDDFGVEIPIHVNMSARQLEDANLPWFVAGELERHDLPPNVLIAELSELDIVAGPPIRQQVRDQLSDVGIALALNDFDAVSASLMHSSPFELIKVDRSFIAGVGTDRRAVGILMTLVHLARRLDMEIIVEGVETDQQRLVLLDVGCRLGQGFLFSPPLNPVAAHALLAARIPLSA